MIDHEYYSCDNCAREFSRCCKHCLKTNDKPPTKFKKKKKTGIQTPELRKPTPPPPPPTNGSNAQKPRTMIYSMKPEDLKGWVNTKAQIGDIAYYQDHISGHQYMYCYRKPDDNPIWIMMQPEFLTDYLQKEKEQEHKMEYKIDIDAMIKEQLDKIVGKPCPYKTPCGWCTKWDKKCDKKIGQVSEAPKKTQPPCFRCESYEYGDPKCPTCKKEHYRYFEERKTGQ